MPLPSYSLSLPAANPQLQSTSSVLATAHDLLASCPTAAYTILTHPNAHAADLRDPVTGACVATSLCGGANGTSFPSSVQARFGVAQVVGAQVIGAQALKAYIEKACAGAEVQLSQMDALPTMAGRRAAMDKAGMSS